MPLLILHDTADIGLGTLAPSLHARSLDLAHVEMTDASRIALDGVAGVLVLRDHRAAGVPDGVIEALRGAMAAEIPIFGVGQGADAVAAALGGETIDGGHPQAGFVTARRTVLGREDEVAAGWPDGTRALTLRAFEVVGLPETAEPLLVGSGQPLLWRAGTAWATPLHVEVDGNIVATWMADEQGHAIAADVGVAPDELIEQARRQGPFASAAGICLVLRFVDGVVSRRDRTSAPPR